MTTVIREEGETIDHLVRRYTDKLKRTRFFDRVKKGAFHRRKVNKRQKKLSALYKNKKREQMDYLKRIGKIEERNFGRYSGRRSSGSGGRPGYSQPQAR